MCFYSSSGVNNRTLPTGYQQDVFLERGKILFEKSHTECKSKDLRRYVGAWRADDFVRFRDVCEKNRNIINHVGSLASPVTILRGISWQPVSI